jgi:hypothetical protein
MAAAVNQLVYNADSASATTIGVGISNTQAGATLHVMVSRFQYDSPFPSVISSVTDSQGNTYTKIGSDRVGDIIIAHYYASNIVGGAGANTVTATFQSSTRYRNIVVKEIRGVTGTPLDVNTGQVQASPGTGTDGVSTGSVSNTIQPALISAFALRVFYDSITLSAGTGFTNDGGLESGTVGGAWRAESKRITTTGSQSATFTVSNNGTTLSVMAVFAESSSMSVTDVDTDETVRSDQTNVVATGVGFGASQGTGSVTLRQGAVTSTQTIDTWADTSIQFDVVQGNIKYGAATLRVTANGGAFAEAAVTLVPPTGELYVNLTDARSPAAERLSGSPEIAAGDQIHYRAVGGGAVPAGLTVNADGTFEFSAGSSLANFAVRAWDATDSTWGSFATQTTTTSQTVNVDPQRRRPGAPSRVFLSGLGGRR